MNFYTANLKRNPVEYDSGTDIEDVKKFVRKYATVKIFEEFEA